MRTTTDIRRSLTPFVVRAFRDGARRTYRVTSDPVSLSTARGWHHEDLDDFRELLIHGVLHAMCVHARGWRQRDVLIGREAWSSQLRQQRVWEAMEPVSLEFSEASLAHCGALFNLVTRPSKFKEETLQRLRKEAGAHIAGSLGGGQGDRLVLYWLCSALWPAIDTGPLQRSEAWTSYCLAPALSREPLLGLRFSPFVDTAQPASIAAITETITEDRRQLPWLLDHALRHWTDEADRIWAMSAAQFESAWECQAELSRLWLKAIRRTGWYHLLIPWFEHFERTWQRLRTLRTADGDVDAPVEARLLTAIEDAFPRLSHARRQALRQSWASALYAVEELTGALDDVRRVHPMERDAHQSWLVAAWSTGHVETVAERLTSLARLLEGRLG